MRLGSNACCDPEVLERASPCDSYLAEREQEKHDAQPRIAILVVVLTMVPVFAFVLDWRLGVFVTAAYGALAFGA